jgi:hypothetical protein
MHHSFALVRALRPSAAATTGGELHVNRRPVRAPPPFQCLPRKRACAPGGFRPTAERTAWARVRSAPRTAYRGRVWVVLNALGASAIPFARSQSSRFGASCLLRIPRQRGPKRFRRLESSLFAEVVSGRRLWLAATLRRRPVGESKPRQRVRPGRQPRFQCQGRARVCRS